MKGEPAKKTVSAKGSKSVEKELSDEDSDPDNEPYMEVWHLHPFNNGAPHSVYLPYFRPVLTLFPPLNSWHIRKTAP